MRRLCLAVLLILPWISQAADLENGKRISRSCALCHGQVGQGTPGPASPRLAGMPPGYTIQQLEHYKSGDRINPRMVIMGSLARLSEEDMEDVAAFYYAINLEKLGLAGIPQWPGDLEKGKEIYLEECKSCHKKNGMGKSRKGIPALALQYSQYLFRQIKMFQWRKRVHDDDPEDDTFDELSDQQIGDLLAHMSSLAPNNRK